MNNVEKAKYCFVLVKQALCLRKHTYCDIVIFPYTIKFILHIDSLFSWFSCFPTETMFTEYENGKFEQSVVS